MNLAIELSTPCSHGTNDNIWLAGMGGTLGGAETSSFISFSTIYNITEITRAISSICYKD